MTNPYPSLLRRWAHYSVGPLGLLLASAGVAQAQALPVSFAPATTYSSGSFSPTAVTVADVNGDGRPDLLTANTTSSGTIGVLLGAGAGAFGAATTYGTGGNNPTDLAVADVNGDGKLDMLAANSTDNTIGVLLGTGTGSFGTATTVSSGGVAPRGIAVADVNGDGKPDILTTNSLGGNIGVLLGTGLGTFGSAITFGTGGSGPSAIVVADVNGDGAPDVLAANTGSQTVGVLLGTGTGAFGTAATFGTGGNGLGGIAVADVNLDGSPDLLTANGSSNTVSVLLGTGSGAFGSARPYSTIGTGTYAFPANVAVADVNLDGSPDLLAANGSGTVGVLLGGGTRNTFSGVTAFGVGVGNGLVGITAADVNGDGRPDVLTTNFSNSEVGVLLNTTANPAPTLTALNPASGPVGTTVLLTGADLTGISAVSFNGTPTTAFSRLGANTIRVTVPAGATTGPVTVTTPTGTSNGLAFALITDLVVTTNTGIAEGIYNSITITGAGIGTLAGDVVVNISTNVQSGGTFNDGCYLVRGAGSFTLAANATLGICATQGIATSGATGAVQSTGLRSFSPEASYVYNGTLVQRTGTGLPSQVRNLSATNPASVTLSAPTSVAQLLTIGAAGNLVTGGNALTLRSNASGTALAVNSSTGVVVGTATVQRYIDPSLNPGLGYRHYASPVSSSTVADLATSGFAPAVNPAYNAAPAPGSVRPYPTVFGYDDSRLATAASNLSAFDKGYFSPAALPDPLAVGRGYAVNIAASEVVDFQGTLNNGDLTLNLTSARAAYPADGGWQLLGNPYPAPLNLAAVDASDRQNLEAAVYIYQSTSQYSGRYRTYINGIGNPIIPLGQGFFTRVASGQPTGSFTFRNRQRLTAPDNTPFQRPAADPRPLVKLELRPTASPDAADEFFAYAQADATAAFDDQLDAIKLPNPTGFNLASLAASGQPLAADARPAFTAATVLPLTVGVPAAGSYSLSAVALTNLPTGLDAYLADDLTGQTTKLSPGTSYAFSVTATQAMATTTGRFRLLFRPATALATSTSLSATDVTVFPNPAHERFTVTLPGLAQATTVQAALLNNLGQVVRRRTVALPATGTQFALDTAELAAGVYTLRLQAGTGILAKRLVLE